MTSDEVQTRKKKQIIVITIRLKSKILIINKKKKKKNDFLINKSLYGTKKKFLVGRDTDEEVNETHKERTIIIIIFICLSRCCRSCNL